MPTSSELLTVPAVAAKSRGKTALINKFKWVIRPQQQLDHSKCQKFCGHECDGGLEATDLLVSMTGHTGIAGLLIPARAASTRVNRSVTPERSMCHC
jgi:hypothetical protein